MLTRKIYGIMITGAVLLMTGCSTEDVTKEVTPGEAVAISFNCTMENNDNMTRAVIGQNGAMNSEDLHYTGFGVFASQTADSQPDLMYNQEVGYTFVGDLEDPLKGYWSYSPVKYWPGEPEELPGLYFCAYAPYVNYATAAAATADDTGIVGMSSNTDTTPYILYRRSLKPDKNVDLLWCYKTNLTSRETLHFNMYHALARLELNLKVASDPGSTKVLVEQITLTGTMTKTAKLQLNTETVEEGNHYPVWQALDPADTESRTIEITNIDNDEDSYGIIDAPIRYIKGLPYAWQPAGLTTTAQNALSTGDRQTYIYLIPQENWSVTVQVDYKTWGSGVAEPTSGTKTVTTQANPLKGNTPYALNITLSI